MDFALIAVAAAQVRSEGVKAGLYYSGGYDWSFLEEDKQVSDDAAPLPCVVRAVLASLQASSCWPMSRRNVSTDAVCALCALPCVRAPMQPSAPMSVRR